MTTTVASPDESDDEPELTPEQRKKLQRQIQGISNNLVPRIEIPKIDLGIDTTAIARITADVARLGHNQIPQTWLKDYTAASILADQSAKILAGLQPYFDIQSALQQQLAPITSDLIKWTMPVQPQLNFLSSQLLKNIDFGWTDEIARIGQQFASYQSKWLEDLKPLLAQVTSDFYPSNLGNDFTLDQIEQVVMLDGIALYEMPRAEIVTPLICASSSAARRENTWPALEGHRRRLPGGPGLVRVARSCTAGEVCCGCRRRSGRGEPNIGASPSRQPVGYDLAQVLRRSAAGPSAEQKDH